MKKIILLLFFVSSIANAGFLISPVIHYDTRNSTTTSGSTETKVKSDILGIDALFGFDMGGFVLGALYHSVSYGDSTKWGGVGVTLGVMNNGWVANFSYLLQSTFDTSTTDFKGTGLVASVGYQWPVGSSFSIGPHVNYNSFTSSSATDASGATSTTEYTLTETQMALGMTFKF